MTATGAKVLAAFSASERVVAAYVCEGKTNAQIGEETGTTEQTVKNRVRMILRKTGCRSRTSLVIFCFYHGIVECPCGGQKNSK